MTLIIYFAYTPILKMVGKFKLHRRCNAIRIFRREVITVLVPFHDILLQIKTFTNVFWLYLQW